MTSLWAGGRAVAGVSRGPPVDAPSVYRRYAVIDGRGAQGGGDGPAGGTVSTCTFQAWNCGAQPLGAGVRGRTDGYSEPASFQTGSGTGE